MKNGLYGLVNEKTKNAIVLFGGRHQFQPNQHILQPRVQSRMLLRCLAGRGLILVNGASVELKTGVFVWMPWSHRLEYRADGRDPMLISGAHIVPDFDSDKESLDFSIPHFSGDPFADSPHRRDCKMEGLDGLIVGTFEKGDGLDLIGEYISEWMWHRERTEATARVLAQLLITELDRAVNVRSGVPSGESNLIHHTRAFVKHRVDEKITLAQMAANAGCSIPTLTRQFNKHLGCSPMQWVLRYKMEHAAELLRSTGLRVDEIGERVGISDAYYFSRIFKKIKNLSPSEYRRQHALF